MRWPGWLAIALVVAVCGCDGGESIAPAPQLAPEAVVAIAMRADDALRAALAGPDPPLESALGGRLLSVERRRAAVRSERQAWIKETLLDRRAVHVNPASDPPEVVLLIRTRTGGATRARQWWAALGRPADRWLVVDAHDLPPPQWWRV